MAKWKYLNLLLLVCFFTPFFCEAQQIVPSRNGLFDSIVTNMWPSQVKRQNIVLDTIQKLVIVPVKAGTSLRNFDPELMVPKGTQVSLDSYDFSKGPVFCKIEIKGQGVRSYNILLKEWHNPVLSGFYADPYILYSENTKRFYIYPTSDGFENWMGSYFKAFSSKDLVHWKDEGIILDLKKDVSWAKRKAWAPTIVERKIDGKFKYFFYYCADGKIGVATSDRPIGPFIDFGKPLLYKRPEGFLGNRGAVIDPDVFQDPQTGKFYLFWGNYYLAGAELNEDMTSIKASTIRELTPKSNYSEGTHVFYRNGIYYFMWSHNDTRDPNYEVRYGTATSPLGDISVPQSNIVIKRDDVKAIYGTGHNSVIKVPGKDQWYLVYHRFTYPKGINMGRSSGYNREVCIDSLQFNTDGSIKQVSPTNKGISAIVF